MVLGDLSAGIVPLLSSNRIMLKALNVQEGNLNKYWLILNFISTYMTVNLLGNFMFKEPLGWEDL